jgi:O-antigen/teichoic acid export membrane protein
MNHTVHQPSISRRLFTNVGLNFAAQVFLALLTIVTAPYIVNRLGAELFGMVALVQTAAGFAGLLNLGIGRALTKYVSELYWKGDIVLINDFFQTAWALSIVTGLGGLVLMIGSSPLIESAFFRGGPEITNDVVAFAIYVSAFGLFSSMLLEVASSIPLAAQRFAMRNAIQVAMAAIMSIGSVILLAAGFSVRAVLLVGLFSNVFGLCTFLAVSCRVVTGLKLRPRIEFKALKTLLGFSLPLLLSAISAMVVARLDRFILAYYLPLAAVAFYALPYSLAQKLSSAVGNVTSVVFPYASELHSMSDTEKLQELYLRSSKILILMTLPFAMVLIVLPDPILRYWLGPEFAEQGAVALCIIGIATFMNAITAVPTVTSLGVGRPWMPSVFSTASSVASLAANLLLIPRYGVNGAALALLLSELVGGAPFIYLINRRLGVTPLRFISDVVARPFVCTMAQLLVLLAARNYINGLISLIVAALISVLVFGLCALFVAMTTDERRALFALAAPGVSFFRQLFQIAPKGLK